MKRILAGLLLGVVFFAVAPNARADFFRVQVRDSFFLPADITILPFDGVNWAWINTLLPHSTTADGSQWDSGIHNSGFIYRRVFTQAGDFPYYCSIHGAAGGIGMSGIVHVVARDHDDDGD